MERIAMPADDQHLRDIRGFLWQSCNPDDVMTGLTGTTLPRPTIEGILENAFAFAKRLAECFRSADREGCELLPDGSVRIPGAFQRLWPEYRDHWMRDGRVPGGLFGSTISPLLRNAILEMFMGANPAFMTYGSFNAPIARLIQDHGTEKQQSALLEPLLSCTWDACLCMSEKAAGSDLQAITTVGQHLEDDVYAITGEKTFITAGYHELTNNTLYLVAAFHSPQDGQRGVSCFLVPRYWPDPLSGELMDNGVRCTEVIEKMGFKGCANVTLQFGTNGLSRGFLLGDRPAMGILHLYPLMRRARVSTGIFGVGMSSNVYHRCVLYAQSRTQGRMIGRDMDHSAPRVALIEHANIQCMLFDMKARVEACRGLLGKVTAYSRKAMNAAGSLDTNESIRWDILARFLNPIAKAYIADQARHVCEVGMRLFGGVGYTGATPIEQYVRDVQVLGIWEGTEYIQARSLLRETSYGRNMTALNLLRREVETLIHDARTVPELSSAVAAIAPALDQCETAFLIVRGRAADGRLWEASQSFISLLAMLGTTISAWILAEGALSCARQPDESANMDDGWRSRARGKLTSCLYYVENVLPEVALHLTVLEKRKAISLSCAAELH